MQTRYIGVILASRLGPRLPDESLKYPQRLAGRLALISPVLDGTNLAVIEADETAGWLGATRTVTLYIGCNLDSGVTVFRLEGWLEGEAVAELERVALESAGPIRLDLSGLRSADAAGLNALRALRATGATLVGASPYIRLLLGS
jgi:hypothetical protein